MSVHYEEEENKDSDGSNNSLNLQAVERLVKQPGVKSRVCEEIHEGDEKERLRHDEEEQRQTGGERDTEGLFTVGLKSDKSP